MVLIPLFKGSRPEPGMMRKTGGNLANLTVKRAFGLLSAAQLMRDLAPTKSSWTVHETDTSSGRGRGIRSSPADPADPAVPERRRAAAPPDPPPSTRDRSVLQTSGHEEAPLRGTSILVTWSYLVQTASHPLTGLIRPGGDPTLEPVLTGFLKSKTIQTFCTCCSWFSLVSKGSGNTSEDSVDIP